MANNDQRNISGLESIAKIYDDGQCTICLGPHINKSLPECGHVYCFQCLVNWCGIKLECPSCKKPFTFFYHTIQSPKDGQVYTPERPLNSTDDPDGLFFVLHEPIGPNVTPEDPEFLFTFEQMLRITEIRPENPIDDRSNRQGNPEFRNPLARIFMIHEFHQASFFSPNSFWL
jgi:hypothetical protein